MPLGRCRVCVPAGVSVCVSVCACTGAKLRFFQENLKVYADEHGLPLSKKQLSDLVEQWIFRHDQRIAEEEESNRRRARLGQPPAGPREQVLTQLREHEWEAFVRGAGLSAPDLTRLDQCRRLLAWQGQLDELPAFAMCDVIRVVDT